MRIIFVLLLVVMAFSCKTVRNEKPKYTIIEARYKLLPYYDTMRFFKFEDMWFPLDTSQAGSIWIRKSDSIYLKINNGVRIDTLLAWPSGTDTTGKTTWSTKATEGPMTVPAKLTFLK